MSDPIKLMAFYLPQFHPIPENDRWWGPGFTEWTNVTRGVPMYEGHVQPRRPGELGYYDLRVRAVRHRQVELARKFGIHGFCYYYYWFSGQRLLEQPLELMLADSEMDFPFCLCWANENWSRRWDGSEDELLVEQRHAPEDPEMLMHDLAPILRDARYLTVGGAPLLLVYRAAMIPDLHGVVRAWRRAAAAKGIPRLHLCAVQSFGYSSGFDDGFDAMVEFPPHSIAVPETTEDMPGLRANFAGKIYSYSDLARTATNAPTGGRLPVYRGIMAGWDNTARRGPAAHIYADASPARYEAWLTRLIEHTRRNQLGDHRLVFINAWNEWAEGTYLEPDEHHQYGYLEATARAVFGAQHPKALMGALRELTSESAEACSLLDALERSIASKDAILDLVETKELLRPSLSRDAVTARFVRLDASDTTVPTILSDRNVLGHLDVIRTLNTDTEVAIDRCHDVLIKGWIASRAVEARPNSPLLLILTNLENGERYRAEVSRRERREDVAEHLSRREGWRRAVPLEHALYSGFRLYAVFSAVRPGSYTLAAIVPDEKGSRGHSIQLHPAVLVQEEHEG